MNNEEIKKLLEEALESIKEQNNLEEALDVLEDALKKDIGLTDFDIRILSGPYGNFIINVSDALMQTEEGLDAIGRDKEYIEQLYSSLEKLINIPLKNNNKKVEIKFIRK